jgi:hypothetical protein
MVQLATPDCIDVDITDNRLVGGNGQFRTGSARPGQVARNEVSTNTERPQPPVPSIYEWQRNQVGQSTQRSPQP